MACWLVLPCLLEAYALRLGGMEARLHSWRTFGRRT